MMAGTVATRTTSRKSRAVQVNNPTPDRGPMTAPRVSMVRWKPKARPCVAGSLEAAMSASRGVVRVPLPTRSTRRASRTSGQRVASARSGFARARGRTRRRPSRAGHHADR